MQSLVGNTFYCLKLASVKDSKANNCLPSYNFQLDKPVSLFGNDIIFYFDVILVEVERDIFRVNQTCSGQIIVAWLFVEMFDQKSVNLSESKR